MKQERSLELLTLEEIRKDTSRTANIVTAYAILSLLFGMAIGIYFLTR